METEKTVEEILAVAAKVNGTDPRLERQNRLNALKIRLEEWLSVLHARREGPSLMEMDLIVKEIENKLESIKKEIIFPPAPYSPRRNTAVVAPRVFVEGSAG